MPKRRVPPILPDEQSDPAIRALIENVLGLFAERCAVFKIEPGSKDFWRLMSFAFALEYLLAERRPPAKARQTKPQRWTASEKKRLLESVRKKTAGGGTVESAIKALRLTKRFSGKQKSLETRFYEAQGWEPGAKRDEIVKIILAKSPANPPSPTRPKRTKKSAAGSTNS